MKHMFGRQLRQAVSKDLIEGCAFVNGELWINVEYLWLDTKDEDKFIERFSKAYQHELMHLLLNSPKKYMYGEERIIRKYVDEDETWTDNLERFYRNDTKKSLPKRTKRRTNSRTK